jgi:hypothetical protein
MRNDSPAPGEQARTPNAAAAGAGRSTIQFRHHKTVTRE